MRSKSEQTDDMHDELLWRLACQLSAQLPVEENDKTKVIQYIVAISDRNAKRALLGKTNSDQSKEAEIKYLRPV